MPEEPQPSDVAADQGRWEWSDLYRKEDWWAIWLSFAILAAGLVIFLPRPPADLQERLEATTATLAAEAGRAPFQTVEWHQANDARSGLRARDEPYARTLARWLGTPGSWTTNPLESLYLSESTAAGRRASAEPAYRSAQEAAARALAGAREAQESAAAAGFQDLELNARAEGAVREWRQAREAERGGVRAQATVQAYNKLPYLAGLLILVMLLFAVGARFMGLDVVKFASGFCFVFLLAVAAWIVGSQATLASWGFGGLIWAILGGMLISNTVGVPEFVRPALQTEYFIKTGLVLLGAEILFSKILAIGQPGIFLTWLVTPVVLVLTYIFGQRVLKIESKTLNIVVSADMSVCGVSAAIATAAACKAKKEELTIAVGMSMLFTSVMMIALPSFIVAVGMHPVLGGAWIGGTVDSTGAVVAAGAFLGQTGMFVAATIKMIQNVMIGVIAFGVAVYWCSRVDCIPGQKVSKMEIWYRFPKFVLGFIAASVVFSAILAAMGGAGDVMIDQGVIRGFSALVRDWFFILAFASIGLSSDFRALAHQFKGGKPAILYVCGQILNLTLTLTVAYILFFKIFPGVTESLVN